MALQGIVLRDMTREDTLYPLVLSMPVGHTLIDAEIALYADPAAHDGVGIDVKLHTGGT